MSDVENLGRQVKDLSPEELAAFRKWFLAYDWEVWDRQLEQDVAAGKLDALAEKALRDHSAGKSTKF
ncbi:MAG TPA: hypothetical protein VGX03_38155 [Candidatus Binatia bacterium]|jgi:hypothetical protein|nr:hypothetical protein [Candidatus Binatia bacterium]